MDDNIELFLQRIAEYGEDIVAECRKEFGRNPKARKHLFKTLHDVRNRVRKADDEVMRQTAKLPLGV